MYLKDFEENIETQKSKPNPLKLIGLRAIDLLVSLFLIWLAFIIPAFYNFIPSPMGWFFKAFLIIVLYRLICFVFYNQTMGMKIFDIQLLNADELPLSFKEKILASFFILYKGVNYYNK